MPKIESACTNIGWVAIFGSRGKGSTRIQITFVGFPMFALVRDSSSLRPVPWVPTDDNDFELASEMPGYLGVDPEPDTKAAEKKAEARWIRFARQTNAVEDDEDEDEDDEEEEEDDEDEEEDSSENDEPVGRTSPRH